MAGEPEHRMTQPRLEHILTPESVRRQAALAAMMMELSHSLTLNEEALQQIPAAKRPLFIFEWLRFLDKVLVAAQKSDIKGCQQKLVAQLMSLVAEGGGAGPGVGPPTRRLLARCLATLFSVGDTFLLFDTVNKCNDILKNKDDSPSYLPTRLAAISCVGSMYEKLGRMMGRSYEETVHILIRSLRSAESQTRIEIMNTLEKVCCGMGSAISNVHKDIYKAARQCLTDRSMPVRCAAAGCLLSMIPHASFLYTTELENLSALCFRAFDGSTYEVRCSVAELLGTLISATQAGELAIINAKGAAANQAQLNKNKTGTSLEEALSLLMGGFLRGGSSFLKGEIIKAGSGVNREVRVGVTHAYVVFVKAMGGIWLERNLTTFLIHVLDLVANPKAASSHVDAVYSRKCINFILRSVLGKMLGEKAQASACKEIIQIIVKQMNSIDFNPENAKDCNQETLFSQHLLVCGLMEIGNLIIGLGTSAQNLLTDQTLNLIEAISAVLIHPCHAARLGAAWCLRCICVAVPTHITPLIDRCVDAIENMRTSPEAISGYSAALAAVLGAVRLSPLGVPHNRGKVIFNTAEELLRSASQNSRLSLNRTHAGWLLIGAIMTLGVPVVRGLLPRMLLLWRNSFPRSNKELESEKARGDAFTWQVTLEGRAGALSALNSLLLHCPSLATDDVTRRLIQPVESALAMLTNIQSVLRQHGQRLKAAAALVRLRLYSCLALLPPAPEPCHAPLLRALVADLALADSAANTATNKLGRGGRTDDLTALGIERVADTDHAEVEDQLLSSLSASGSGALEHDPCCLYQVLENDQTCPGPLPLGVAVIDMSVVLFGLIFPRVANKHRLQMLDHFSECIRLAKSTRQEAIQTNVFAALLGGLRGLAEAKGPLGGEDVRKSASALITNGLSSSSPAVRCLAGQCAGRLAQTLSGSPSGGAEGAATALADSFCRQLQAGRGITQRTGLCMALGALYRARGGIMGGGGHYGSVLPVLLALAQDQASSDVQIWSLHALSLIADAGGPMFRGFVEPTLTMALNLLLQVPPSHEDVHRCLGKLLSALITTIGPELQGNTTSICTARSMFLCACAIMQEVGAPSVQAEAIGSLQQLHLFAPRHLNLSTLVPTLCRNLASKHLVLRRAAISCLRQLSQKEAKDVCQHALSLIGEHNNVHNITMSETGLPGTLFAMLDTETDRMVVQYIHDTLTSMVQVLSAGQLSQWLSLCKAVLTVQQESTEETPLGDGDGDGEGDDDQAEFHADQEVATHPPIQPRWPTRVFAMECVQRIMVACESAGEAHFDLLLAKEQQLTRNNVDYLVLHLADLIRMAFMAATSESDPLRLEGLRSLRTIITRYCRVPEPEFPGHLLLEQFQAQVGAALRPAFAPDTPSHVTSAACEVCSTWIGSGVARDLNDLRRVHQLLVSSLHKLNAKLNNSANLYNESLATLEKLAILKAWAEIYIVAMISNGSAPGSAIKQLEDIPSAGDNQGDVNKFNSNLDSPLLNEPTKNPIDDDFGNFEFKGESLLKLVQPELENLANNWYAALKDHALLSLPPEFSSQLPHDGGAFYTADTVEGARGHYHEVWPAILHAMALNFNNYTQQNTKNENKKRSLNEQLENLTKIKFDDDGTEPLEPSEEKFHLLFGICMEALCTQRNTTYQSTMTCLLSLNTLLDTASNRMQLLKDRSLAIELCHVLHRTGLTQESAQPLLLTAEVLHLTILAAKEDLERRMQEKIKELSSGDAESDPPQSVLETVQLLGEGGPTGDLPPGKSLLFSCLEVCLCLLVRQLPNLSPNKSNISMTTVSKKISQYGDRLLIKVLGCMSNLTALASPHGAVAILPTILYLNTGVIKETGQQNAVQQNVINAAVELLGIMGRDKHSQYPDTKKQWGVLMQSVLAKIIDLSKNDEEDVKMDHIVTLQAMSAILPYAPPTQMLHFPCINHYRLCLQSADPSVVIRCANLLKDMWSLGSGWARALAPPLLKTLRTSRQPNSQLQLKAVVAQIGAAEALLPFTPEPNRVQMLCLLVPIIVAYLRDAEELKNSSAPCKALHDYSLQWLMKIGPKYQQEFKTIMSQSNDMRLKLENAVKANQQTLSTNQNRAVRAAGNTQQNRPAKPSIQLKTDFSNFN